MATQKPLDTPFLGEVIASQSTPWVMTGSLNIVNSSGWAVVVSNTAGTAFATSGVIIASSSTVVLAANTARKEAIVVNDSTVSIYLGYGTAVGGRGVRINANGGSLIETIYTGQITGIVASGTGRVTVVEV